MCLQEENQQINTRGAINQLHALSQNEMYICILKAWHSFLVVNGPESFLFLCYNQTKHDQLIACFLSWPCPLATETHAWFWNEDMSLGNSFGTTEGISKHSGNGMSKRLERYPLKIRSKWAAAPLLSLSFLSCFWPCLLLDALLNVNV